MSFAKSFSSHTVLLVPVEIAVDANRDGTIDVTGASDQTTQSQPYRFWINDDQDSTSQQQTSGEGGGVDITEGDVVPVVTPDYTDPNIQCKRDLEDWTRLWISFKGSASIIKGMVQNGYSVGLQFEAVSSTQATPTIKICEAVESDGGTGYLTDDGIANQQITGSYDVPIEDPNGNSTIGSSPFMLPSDFWDDVDDNTPKHLIFEGCSEGVGKLTLVFYDANNNKVGEGGAVYLDLKNIKKMYQRGYAQAGNTNMPYTYTSNPPGPNITLGTDPNSAQKFEQPSDETPQCIVFVHGFNMDYNHSTNYAETLFKRLWWRGYKGRLAALRWPTFGDGGDLGAIGTYNNSEYMAWNSGAALKQYVASLPSNYAIDFVAHSMGNMVVGEALREGARGNHYALLHAASSASCYSNANFSYQVVNTGVQTADTDPDPGTKNLAYTGWLGSIGANPVNFCDPNDSVVVSKWDANNSAFKPQRFNGAVPSPWAGTNGYFYNPAGQPGERLGISFLLSVGRFITDPAEAKAFADFSLCGTIGGGNKQAGQWSGGAITDSVDDSRFGDDHSNEWDWDIQDLESFYNTLLLKFELPRNP